MTPFVRWSHVLWVFRSNLCRGRYNTLLDFCSACNCSRTGCRQVAWYMHDPNGIIDARSASPLAPDLVAAISDEGLWNSASSLSPCNQKYTMRSDILILDRIVSRFGTSTWKGVFKRLLFLWILLDSHRLNTGPIISFFLSLDWLLGQWLLVSDGPTFCVFLGQTSVRLWLIGSLDGVLLANMSNGGSQHAEFLWVNVHDLEYTNVSEGRKGSSCDQVPLEITIQHVTSRSFVMGSFCMACDCAWHYLLLKWLVDTGARVRNRDWRYGESRTKSPW